MHVYISLISLIFDTIGAQQSEVDSVLTWSNILYLYNFVDLSSKWESLKLMHIFWDKRHLYDFQFCLR